MINRNYSEEIRKYIIECYALLSAYFKTYDEELLLNGIKESFNSSFDDNASKMILLSSNKTATPNDIQRIKPMVIFSIIQMYTDYYRYLKFQDIIEDTNNTSYLNFDSFEEVLWFFNQENMINDLFNATMEYKESSAYDKVLLEKCLTAEEKVKLLKINPFYEFEMNKFNVNVDIDLINRQIKKWQNSFPNNIELSYNQTASFLSDLYKINKNEVIEILKNVINKLGDINITNYSPDENTYINHNNYVLDELLLEKIIGDYYNQENNKLTKKIGDK